MIKKIIYDKNSVLYIKNGLTRSSLISPCYFLISKDKTPLLTYNNSPYLLHEKKRKRKFSLFSPLSSLTKAPSLPLFILLLILIIIL